METISLKEAPGRRYADHRWGVVLAGGDGVRLRPLTHFLFGDDRPKQFCPLLNNRTLLRETRDRAERSINPEQVLYSLTQSHAQYYSLELPNQVSQRIVQPSNRGTAPAILGALLHILEKDPEAVVAILPCDHYYSSEQAFTASLDAAFSFAESSPSCVVLLGAQPSAPEVEYGWIELGDAVARPYDGFFRVRRFHEKPPQSVAKALFNSGALWNTFVMVGHIAAFLELATASVPHLVRALRYGMCLPDDNSESSIPEWLYRQIQPSDFAREILAPGASQLVSMPLHNIVWSDLGDSERVIETLVESGASLAWMARWRAITHPVRAPQGEPVSTIAS